MTQLELVASDQHLFSTLRANNRAFFPPSLRTSFHRNGVLFLIKYKFYLWFQFATSTWWIRPISLYFAHTPLGKTTLVSLQHHHQQIRNLFIFIPWVCCFCLLAAWPFLLFQLRSLTGLPPQIHNNISSPPAVSSWAVIYFLFTYWRWREKFNFVIACGEREIELEYIRKVSRLLPRCCLR